MVFVTHGNQPKIEGHFERYVKDLLDRSLEGKFFALSECAKYKPSEDFGIRNQIRGESKEIVEVYFQGRYLCDVDSEMTKDEIVGKVSYRLKRILKELGKTR